MSWFDTLTVTSEGKDKTHRTQRERRQWLAYPDWEINLTAAYLFFFLLSIWVALLSVRMMLQKLSYICHDGFLIRLVYINIWGGNQMNVIRSNTKPSLADNSSTAHLTDIYSKTGTLNENNLQHFGSVSKFCLEVPPCWISWTNGP